MLCFCVVLCCGVAAVLQHPRAPPPLQVAPDDVVRVIRRFVEEREEIRRQELQDGGLGQQRMTAAEDAALAQKERTQREVCLAFFVLAGGAICVF